MAITRFGPFHFEPAKAPGFSSVQLTQLDGTTPVTTYDATGATAPISVSTELGYVTFYAESGTYELRFTRTDHIGPIIAKVNVSGAASAPVAVVHSVASVAPVSGDVPAASLVTALVGAGLITTVQAQALVDALVNAAPGTLNTLKELADALGDDPNFATTIATALATKASTAFVSGAIATQHTADNTAYVPLPSAGSANGNVPTVTDHTTTPPTMAWATPGGGWTYLASAAGTGIVGNGTTDDAAAISTWLGSLPAGSTAFFPAKTYKIASALTAPAGQITVIGEGDATVWNFTADNITGLTLTSANNRSSFARLKMQLDTTAPTSMLLKLDGVFNLDFDRVTIIGQKASQAATYDGQIGVFSTNNAGDTRFRACTITQLGIGVAQDCEETTYESCHISQNKVNLVTFGVGAGANVVAGITKGSSNTAGASTSDYGFLFLGQGHHQMSTGWCEAVNTACLQVGQNTTASTTVAAGSNGAILAAIRTLTVADTSTLPATGTCTVVTSTGTKTIAYSSKDSTHLYGVVTSGTGTVSTGAAVATTPVGPVMCNVEAFFNGGATYGVDVQKGRITGSMVVGSPGTFGTPVRLDATNSSGKVVLDIPSGTLPTVPNTYSVDFHVSSSPGSWVSPLVVTTQGSSRTLVYADANTIINVTVASTLTVPTNATAAFPVGTIIGAVATGGTITVAAAGGVTISNASSLTSRATNSMIFLTKIATDTWVLSGDVT